MLEVQVSSGIRMEGLTPAYDTTPSPFLPDTNIQYAWDSTSLGYTKTCPRLYQYIMIDGWGSGEESIHLRFGQEYHQALQEYDIAKAEGLDHEGAMRQTVKDLLLRTWDREANRPWTVNEETKAGKYKNRRSLVRSVIWYLEHFKTDAAETLILDSGKPAVELSFRFGLDWGPNREKIPGYDPRKQTLLEAHKHPEYRQPYLLCGHLDRVVRFQDALFVMDHKTTTTTPGSYYFDQYAPNNQMSLYTFASQIVINSPVKGVIISAAQLMVDSSRFVRGFTYRTPDQIQEWVDDLHYWFDLAEGYATAGYWPQNDTACNNFGGCRFREVCSKSPQVREQFLKAKFTKLPESERWNPLRSR